MLPSSGRHNTRSKLHGQKSAHSQQASPPRFGYQSSAFTVCMPLERSLRDVDVRFYGMGINQVGFATTS
jgi:hypothetical protein